MAKHRTANKEPAEAPPSPGSEGYTVLARRYRPQGFGDLVGQEPIARALTNALSGNRVAHAYLFTGARGVGKTSTARILAKALNCEKGPTSTPCHVCEICRSIASGEDVDVLEIDGASHTGVDNIRDIRSNVQYRPQRARYKIYIIDEVHMLSKGAFNALLKTLEEPPPHVKFIFATTEVEKIPITILSRCQRFDFAGIPLPRIVARLQEIIDQEQVGADREALELIARRAGGSMRDAQSLLDQLLAFGSDRLTTDLIHRLLGTAGDDRIVMLADAVLTSQVKQSLDLLDEACVGGLQLGELIEQLIAYWRDLMVVACAGTEGRDLSVPSRHHPTLRRQAESVSLDAILAGLDVLAVTKSRMRGSQHTRTLVEMALVRLGRLSDLVSLSQLSQWLGQNRLDSRAAAPAAVPGAGRPRPMTDEPVKKNRPVTAEGESSPAAPQLSLEELSPQNWPQIWSQIVGFLGTMLSSDLAKAGCPAISGPNSLVFQFPGGYNSIKEAMQRPERHSRVEDAFRRVFGKPVTVNYSIGASSGETKPEETASRTTGATRSVLVSKEEAEKVPLVRRAVEVLGASVQRVDEGFGETELQPPENSQRTRHV
ncbi:MAG: DNA polymerase III subunit gamma/tau [Gemmataceae bacterium]